MTAKTQQRFEELYDLLTEHMSEHRLAVLISEQIDKAKNTVLMYIRERHYGGSEEVKRPYVTAMEIIAAPYLPKEEEVA
ncbi:MAG: hypothetical protein AB1763_09270 [Campylobacterota bacterium]